MGFFLTFEGPEGGGKTTQAAALAETLKARGYPVLATREPGGTRIGKKVREILLDLENTEMDPRTEILLFQASRAQLVEQVIRPHLESGGVVLSDRYADSTLAYQGYGHGVDLDRLRLLIDFATGGLTPDLTVLLDVEVETGLRRRADDGGWNRLDAYDLAFQRRVRQGFLTLARLDPDRWLVVDANRPVPDIQGEIEAAVLARLKTGLRADG